MIIVPSSALDSMNLGAMGGFGFVGKKQRGVCTRMIFVLKIAIMRVYLFILVLCCCLLASCSSIGSGFSPRRNIDTGINAFAGDNQSYAGRNKVSFSYF